MCEVNKLNKKHSVLEPATLKVLRWSKHLIYGIIAVLACIDCLNYHTGVLQWIEKNTCQLLKNVCSNFMFLFCRYHNKILPAITVVFTRVCFLSISWRWGAILLYSYITSFCFDHQWFRLIKVLISCVWLHAVGGTISFICAPWVLCSKYPKNS